MQDDQSPTRRQTDVIDPARAAALLATLDLPGEITIGAPLPPFFHQIYFWDARAPGALGRDGHPQVGDALIPDLGLPRRMWAGGALEFFTPLRAGIEAEKRSTCIGVDRKTGRSGVLGFVTLEHEIWQAGSLCLRERQDLVYREDPSPEAPRRTPPQAPCDETAARALRFSPTLLFRYSALTFNGHRIHYDAEYARGVEGYGGLVVHGPLLAQSLMLMATDHAPLKGFSFRGTAPLMDHETATLCANGPRMWVRGPDNRLCMEASARF